LHPDTPARATVGENDLKKANTENLQKPFRHNGISVYSERNIQPELNFAFMEKNRGREKAPGDIPAPFYLYQRTEDRDRLTRDLVQPCWFIKISKGRVPSDI